MTSNTFRRRARLGTALAALAISLGSLAVAAPAAAAAQSARPSETLNLSQNTGTLVRLSSPMSDVFVANDSIADIQVRSSTQLYVFGKASGETTVYATDKAGRVVYAANALVDRCHCFAGFQAVTRRVSSKDRSMSRSIILLGLVSALGACQTPAPLHDNPAKGLSPVNVPVVTRADYALDLSAPDGTLASSEAARLDGWFRSMELGYGDMVYVDGPSGYGARDDVARVAGQYGMLVSLGSPITAGPVPQGMVRVVVTRTEASVPNCPNWSRRSTPAYDDASTFNFGCGVNSDLAAMIANPQDLVHGREGSGVGDTLTSSKAVEQYRKAIPTGQQGLKDISTKGK